MHFNKTQKKFFVNNFCVPELKALKFLIQKKTMVMLISGASPSPIFHSGKLCKNNSVFLLIYAKFPCKTEKFELEFAGLGVLATGFCF